MKSLSKRVTSIFLSLVLLISTVAIGTLSVEASATDGYTAIYNDDDFYNIRNNPSGKYYLAEDIVFDSSYYIMNGKYFNNGNNFQAFDKFTGILDGNGHSIIGLKGDYGICETNTGTIKNVKIEDCQLKAGICYYNKTTVQNCYIENSTIDYGVVYSNNSSGTVKYCFSKNSEAPVVYYNYGTIDGCVNYSDITVSSGNCAGICVRSSNGTITNCINFGDITSNSRSAGIVFTSTNDATTINACANYGSITSNNYDSFGISYEGIVTECINYGTITSKTDDSYGIAYDPRTIQGCVNYGDVIAPNTSSYDISYAISNKATTACYYLEGSGDVQSSKAVAVAVDDKSNAESYPLLDFTNVWQISDDGISLQMENEKQIETALYYQPSQIYYNVGDELYVDDMLVMTFNNYGEWLIDDDYTIDGFTGAIGKNVVTVTAKGYSTTFDTYVYDDISTKKILISQTEYLYNGNECTPTITVINSNGKKLSQNTDYALVYENNVNPGLGKVYIYGIGNYNGSVTKTFIITPKQTTGLKVSSRSTTSLKLAWTKQSGVTGYVVQKYDSKNKKWATYKTITSNTNSITVSKLSSATTYKFRVRSYKTINGKKYYGDYSSTLTTPTKPAKVTNLKSVYSYQRKNNTDCFKTTWKKVSGATGYQLYYVREGNTSKTITVKNVNSYTYKVSARDYSALKVKIRAYKTVDGKKYYSDWSSYAKIKF